MKQVLSPLDGRYFDKIKEMVPIFFGIWINESANKSRNFVVINAFGKRVSTCD